MRQRTSHLMLPLMTEETKIPLHAASFGRGKWRVPFLCLLLWQGEVAPVSLFASPYGKGRCRAERDGGDKKARFRYKKLETLP